MWRRLWWLSPVVAAVACTGLYLENGNAYPCDFAEGPGLRDAVCQPGDVCGINNVCKKYLYEGPRFEGPATLPVYGPASGEGLVLHPLALKNAAVAVLADIPVSRSETGYVQDTSGTLSVLRDGHLLQVSPRLPSMLPPGFGLPTKVQTYFDDGVALLPNVLLRDDLGHLAMGQVEQARAEPVRGDGGVAVQGFDFRVVERPLASPRDDRTALAVAWNQGRIGQLDKVPGNWFFNDWSAPAPSRVFDVAGVTQPRRLWVLALTQNEVTVFDLNDGGVTPAADLDGLTVSRGALRTDPGNHVVAAVRRGAIMPMPAELDVLSTFQVNIDAAGVALSSPWPDCTPCGAGQQIELIAPSVRSGAPTVELVCIGGLRLPQPLRVIGSVALSQGDPCLTEEIELPVSLSRVASLGSRVVQWDAQAGLLVGGRKGELWAGETISTLQPQFLDRVPRDVAPALTGTMPSLAAIADDYLAVQQTTDTQQVLPPETLNGFRRIPTKELGVSEDSKLLAFVHGVGGWGVANSGEVVRVRIIDKVVGVKSGPQLVSAAGDPIRDSIGGEAVTLPDGGPLGFFLAADDSLYFLDDPETSLLPTDEQEQLTPDLTPEPSVPIRSLALERTPLGTEVGTERGDRARGYLVTSRNVFSWELSGTPARWSSNPLLLAAGEPLEVWFDSSRSALGRVGYRDGEIYSLPGGYLLAEALPADEDGVPAQVLDYENLGGWPVAYATTGLFVAGWDQVNGKLQNRFDDVGINGGINRPMTWREVKLGGDATPWMRTLPDGGVPRVLDTRPGRLFVAIEPPVAADGGREQTHRLLLFLDDQVLQVARHVRYLK